MQRAGINKDSFALNPKKTHLNRLGKFQNDYGVIKIAQRKKILGI